MKYSIVFVLFFNGVLNAPILQIAFEKSSFVIKVVSDEASAVCDPFLTIVFLVRKNASFQVECQCNIRQRMRQLIFFFLMMTAVFAD